MPHVLFQEFCYRNEHRTIVLIVTPNNDTPQYRKKGLNTTILTNRLYGIEQESMLGKQSDEHCEYFVLLNLLILWYTETSVKQIWQIQKIR